MVEHCIVKAGFRQLRLRIQAFGFMERNGRKPVVAVSMTAAKRGEIKAVVTPEPDVYPNDTPLRGSL